MPAPHAFFLPAQDGESGHRFCLFHPSQREYLLGCVLYIHPFAEEMNKSRRMAALQARALSGAGYAVLQIDLHGCGDSSGDFGDASWPGWIEDVVQAARWLRQRAPAPLWLWGLRAGCLLAAEAAGRLDGPCHFLFWAPPAAGKVLLQQFLRLKAAGALLGGDAITAADSLHRQRARGLPVEVAGYTLAPALSAGLEHAVLSPPVATRPALAADLGEPGRSPCGSGSRVVWFELSLREDAPLSFAASSALAEWQRAGHQVQGQRVHGPAFWQSVEIEDAPALLEATLAALTEASPAPAVAPRQGEAMHPAAGAALPPSLAPQTQGGANAGEEPLVFGCARESLLGILHHPAGPGADTAVLVIVGGPQYRAGSHRQFVLLSRCLAAAGHPVLRFDYRGMGDSSGALHDFQQVDDDIRAALDRLQQRLPSVRHVVLWGLCDGASAALLYCHATADARVRGVCALNPWVRSPRTEARTRLKHYYAGRVLQPEFWRKLIGGKVAAGALDELLMKVKAANAPKRGQPEEAFQQRMARAWTALEGGVLLILSGRDYTAKEFIEYAAGDETWRDALRRPRTMQRALPDADHTFSDASSRAAVERLTLEWLGQLVREAALNRSPEQAELLSDGGKIA